MKKNLTFLFITALIVCKTNFTSAQVDINDSLALVYLYDSTGGSNWTNHTNWLTAAPISSWFGITVAAGRVTWVSLGQNNLNGKIPYSIGNLTSLEVLYFYDDFLKGSIPSSIGKLTKLKWLALDNNHLTGHIPASFGKLINLETVFMINNQLTGAIPSLKNLDRLYELDLNYNQLTDTIPMLSTVANFGIINLDHNRLTGNIPTWLGNCSISDQLTLNDNQITGEIPSAIGNLTNVIFDVSNNKLSGRVPEALSNVYGLYIANNQLNFDGIEYLDSSNSLFEFAYAPQANIPITYHTLNSMLSVSAGGTLKNNTYKWYRNGSLYKTVVGDSTFIADSAGTYHVEVTNYFATQLTLISDSIVYTALTLGIKKNISVTEGNSGYTIAQFKIGLNRASASTVKVNYTTKDGTALAGSDYVSNSGTLTFKPGKISKNITINVIGDNTYESNEKFSLVLSNPVNAVLGELDSAVCTIKNDDPLSPQLPMNNDAATANASGKLYPNPVRDELIVEGVTKANATFAIVDMQGRELIRATASDETRRINVKQLSPGVYYLRIETAERIEEVKFIKF